METIKNKSHTASIHIPWVFVHQKNAIGHDITAIKGLRPDRQRIEPGARHLQSCPAAHDQRACL
jgi:hypothetical protein